jgi:hypothetical protein
MWSGARREPDDLLTGARPLAPVKRPHPESRVLLLNHLGECLEGGVASALEP